MTSTIPTIAVADQRLLLLERAAIMQYDGGCTRHEAEQLARSRPWDTDRHWGAPRPQQVEMDLGLGEFRDQMRQIWKDY
jgi:hypothetical protein